ncbi:hypothetical protein [Micromonospora coxensis]|nr:hypothetical protein [Micromonospora coxensis]
MLAAIGTAMLSVILFHEVNTRPPAALADAYGRRSGGRSCCVRCP